MRVLVQTATTLPPAADVFQEELARDEAAARARELARPRPAPQPAPVTLLSQYRKNLAKLWPTQQRVAQGQQQELLLQQQAEQAQQAQKTQQAQQAQQAQQQ